MVKNPPANAGDIRDVGLILGQEDALEKGMETHSSIFAWRIPWAEEPAHRVAKSWIQPKQYRTHILTATKSVHATTKDPACHN